MDQFGEQKNQLLVQHPAPSSYDARFLTQANRERPNRRSIDVARSIAFLCLSVYLRFPHRPRARIYN